MNDLWQSLPREDCGIRRMNGAAWMLLFDVVGVAAIAAWFIWRML